MAESIRQYMLDMIEQSQAQSTEEMIERGELPDKSTQDFTMEELDLIMQARPTAVLELFERSGWELDDAGRDMITKSLQDEVNKDKEIDVEAKKAFNKMTILEREVLIRYRAIGISNIGAMIFENMHIKSSDNPLNVPKFVEEFNYETLILCVINPSDQVGLVFNTLNGQRIITSSDRAKRFYLDGYLAELEPRKLKLKTHETTVDSKDGTEKLYVTLIGHLYKDDHLAISISELLAEAAMAIVTDKLKNKIMNKFHQADNPEENLKDDEDKPTESSGKPGSRIHFPKWSDEEDEDSNDSEDNDNSDDDNDDNDNLVGGLYGTN
jgi:hypothetical protein